MSTVKQALTWGASKLQSSTPQLDAEVLLSATLGLTKTQLYTYPEKELEPEQERLYQALIQRRKQGEPIAYLTGHQEFWSLDFEVSPDVLIPRADTELLVETALSQAGNLPKTVLDLGTGSGAIAVAIAHDRPDWQVYAMDRSLNSLKLAQRNAHHHQTKVGFIQGDWLKAFKEHSFDIILSNPPYIDASDPHLLAPELQLEPQHALVSEDQGYADLKHLAQQAPRYLKAKGWLMMEHGSDQGPKVRDFLTHAGFIHVETLRDLAGHDRVSLGQIEP